MSATIPHSNAAALSKRACYFALIAQKGNPLFWFTANTNAVENQIVLHMINRKVLPFGNLSFVEKITLRPVVLDQWQYILGTMSVHY